MAQLLLPKWSRKTNFSGTAAKARTLFQLIDKKSYPKASDFFSKNCLIIRVCRGHSPPAARFDCILFFAASMSFFPANKSHPLKSIGLYLSLEKITRLIFFINPRTTTQSSNMTRK